MKVTTMSKNYGAEAITGDILQPLKSAIEDINFDINRDSTTFIRDSIEHFLSTNGWAMKVRIDVNSNINITAKKENTGLCIQTGNMSRYYADILKLETLYRKNKIKNSVLVVPTKEFAKLINDNIVNSERVGEEVDIFKHIITVPLVIICIEQSI